MGINIAKFKNLNKNFHDFKLIGTGGFGEVYSAYYKDNKEPWAVKVLTENDINGKAINIKRFGNEIAVLKKIKGENIVKFWGHYLNSDGCYIAMELIEGSSLKQRINKDKFFSAEQTVHIAKQICQGLIDIHAHQVVHRDLKPSNILFDKYDTVKLIDFGISLSEDSLRVTTTNKIVGSIYYIAPEVLLGKASPSAQSDIYALGILIYEMLTGNPPFKSNEQEIVVNGHINGQIPPLKNVNKTVPQALENIILKCTAKKPEDRYLTAQELYYDLNTCLSTKRVNEKRLKMNNDHKKTAMQRFNSKAFSISLITIGIILITILAVLIGLFAGGVI
ncbi:serine/threonine-protein kinase [[Mycoplasma] anseris]|uniref:non-specific serine/threonine protein kinase n=1 Tax=[Mycoplasma] anseris TaxID=92400 RepID=A0A2Z4NDD9_9BACT|nr:serine/threonine-protein kinase [[Mycoplasma] anseris]AWX69518.1 serine/threonine protein kinase [[Mycoplasma] anseris]